MLTNSIMVVLHALSVTEIASSIYILDALSLYTAMRASCKPLKAALPTWTWDLCNMVFSFNRLSMIVSSSAPVQLDIVKHCLQDICDGLQVCAEDKVVLIVCFVMQHISLLWKCFMCAGVHFAWEVREYAALILRDLVVQFEQNTVLQKFFDLYEEALVIYELAICEKPDVRDVAIAWTELEPLSYKAWLCTASILAGDMHWIWTDPPHSSRWRPRMFVFEIAPDIPYESSDASSDETNDV